MALTNSALSMCEEEVTPHTQVDRLTRTDNHSVKSNFGANMSIDGTKLLFEGFLEKRKDTMKIRWATYWFRLQNTTLFFYTKKNGSASHLRGSYYIYTVQSVREVQRAERKRFMFEIIMTNGKRKLLAAETAGLRQQWVGHLWQAMHLSASGVPDYRNTLPHVGEQQDRINSSAHTCSQSDSVMESLPARPLSAPAPSGIIHHETRCIAPSSYQPQELNSEEATYQNILTACDVQHHSGDSLNSQWSSGLSNSNGQEGDYDVLPVRKRISETSTSTEMNEEAVYDFPLSYRKLAEHSDPTDSIYDVPSTLLRTISDHTSDFSSEEQLGDELYWRI